MIMIL
ncbi:hypothetical protein ACHAXM_000755, partial [Skeletonema potamos]